MAEELLRDNPELRPFVLSNVRLTGTELGAGAYGRVDEVEIPVGAAAKTVYDVLLGNVGPRYAVPRAVTEFVRECKLMSTLRHPNIVKFLGVCFFPRSRLPALVMERLLTSLHDLLTLPPPSAPTPLSFFTLNLKCCVLHDVASGLAYLHERSPPIIHRDLSARNVLLNSGMVAKIADLGVARIVPHMRAAATMTKGPGTSVYMPPEAVAPSASNTERSKYDASIDIFSFGVVTIFTISETFPCDLLAPTYTDEKSGLLLARTELQRRIGYIRSVNTQLRGDHPLIRLIHQCLHNLPAKRPGISEVLHLLHGARAGIRDEENERNRQELVQAFQIQPRNQNLDRVVSDLVAENAALQSRAQEVNELQQQQLQSSEREKQTIRQQLTEELTRAAETIRREQKQIREMGEQETELQQQLTRAEKETQQKGRELAQAQQQLRGKEEQLRSSEALVAALKLQPQTKEGGSDLMTLISETEQLRKDVKSKDALLVRSEEQLEQVNTQNENLERQYNNTLQELEEQKDMLEEQKKVMQRALREKEAELRKMRAERASKEEIESMEIEIMYLKNKIHRQKAEKEAELSKMRTERASKEEIESMEMVVKYLKYKIHQHQVQERDLWERILDLQEQLEANEISTLELIASNLEKEVRVQPEFETERSQMLNNIHKMLKYSKIPDEMMGEEEEDDKSPDPELVAATDMDEQHEDGQMAGNEDKECSEDGEEEEEKEAAESDGEDGERTESWEEEERDEEVIEETVKETTPEAERCCGDGAAMHQICRLCNREVSDAINLFSEDSIKHGVADGMSTVLELPFKKEDGITSYVCQICNARFKQLIRRIEVLRLEGRKTFEKLASKAGVYPEYFEAVVDDTPKPKVEVEDANNPTKDPLVEAADMTTNVDLGSLLSDLVAAKQHMRAKAPPTEKKVVTDDIRNLMNLLSWIRKEDVFVFGTFLRVPDACLCDLELKYTDDRHRLLVKVLEAWIERCPETSTWTILVEALTEVGRRKYAQQVAEERGIVLPGVFDDEKLWTALKALIPLQEGGSDLMTLMSETEQLRKDVKSKDALLVRSEEQLEQVNTQKENLERQYNNTLQELQEQKHMLEEQKKITEGALREKEAELRKMRSERASKEEIESMEIEIMYLKNKIHQHQVQERDLRGRILDLQEQLEANDISRLELIASNLAKEVEGVRPEFETERSQMLNNIYKMLKYIKMPEEMMGEEEEEDKKSSDPELLATVDMDGQLEDEQLAGNQDKESSEDGEEGEKEKEATESGGENGERTESGEEKERAEGVIEETLQETTPEPEPTDLVSLLSSLKSPTEDTSAVEMFEDKRFVCEDESLAEGLFEGVPPFLLNQILGLTMEQWLAIEAADRKDEGKQRCSVLREWEKGGSSAKWSVLVETLTELGLRSRAQSVFIEKGIPLPEVNEDGPVWKSMKETLLRGNETVKQLFGEAEGLRAEVKSRNEMICVKEVQLEQAKTEGELIKVNLRRVKQEFTKKMSQCKMLEMQISQKSLSSLDPFQGLRVEVGEDSEMSVLKEQHKKEIGAIQSLWKEQQERKRELERHSSTLEPELQQLEEMKAGFGEMRENLVNMLEEMYDLYTGREKPVPKEAPNRPPPPMPKPPPAPVPVQVPPSLPITPGGYRTTNQLLPSSGPVMPTGYTIMDLFHPSNTFSLLPAIDPVARPLTVSGNLFTGVSLKGKGYLTQECVLTSEIAAPFVVTLKVPSRGRLMVDDRRMIVIKKTPYQPGDPAFEFIVRPYEQNKVTFESRRFGQCFLSCNQNADVSVRELPPDYSEVQFVVRVQQFRGPYTTHITCPFGRPSLANQLKDKSVIQLYSKSSGVYLGLQSGGNVVGMKNPDNDSTHLVYCDRGLGRVSLQSHKSARLKIKMRFNGMLTCQGKENLDNDFYLKENIDGTVVFESVPNKGRYINVTQGNMTIWNFSINVLVFNRGQVKTITLTKYQLSERCTELEEKSARKENYDPLPSKMSGNVSSLRKFYSVSATAIKGDDQFRDRDTERKRKYRSVPKQTAIVLKHPPQGTSRAHMPEPFSRIATVMNCSHDGTVFYDNTNEFGLEIPEGAIPEQESITIDIGVAMYGPFEFPEGLKPVSPVFWVCTRESRFSCFLKPVTITIPHCIDLKSSDSLSLTFLKGDHEVNAQKIYQFQRIKGSEMVFEAQQLKGVLKIIHFCSLCISGKVSPELTKNTKFCIYAALPLAVPPLQTTYCRFFISYLLATCIATVEKQITGTQELKSHTNFLEDFNFSCEQDEAALEIVLPESPSSEWNIGLYGKTKISLSAITDFVKVGEDILRLKEEKGMYPPRFNVNISCSSTAKPGQERIQFKGATCKLVYDIQLNPQHSPSATAAKLTPQNPCDYGKSDFPLTLDVFLNHVGTKIQSKWRHFGIALKIPQYELDTYPADRCLDCFIRVFGSWERKDSPELSWQTVISILESSILGEEKLAAEVKGMLSGCVSPTKTQAILQ